MNGKRILAGILLAVLVLSAAAPQAQAQDQRLQVVASFSILGDVVRNVAGDAADVETLIPLGANPHAYEPSAQDVVTLSKADVVFVAGANFEEGLLPVLQEAAQSNMVVASECVSIRPVEVGDHTETVPVAEPTSDQGTQCATHHTAAYGALGLEDDTQTGGFLGELYQLECGGHDHEDGEHDGEDEHAAGSCDPHVWTDPVNVALWALMVRDTLSERDPANADIYAANTDAYLADLAAMNTQVQDLIDTIPADQRSIVTNHLAFSYFAKRYGLTLVGVVIPGGSTTSEPSVQDVLALIQTVKDHHVPAIFTETTVSQDIAQQIADEAGAQIVRLYTGSLSDPDGDAGTYIQYMEFNASQMADALK